MPRNRWAHVVGMGGRILRNTHRPLSSANPATRRIGIKLAWPLGNAELWFNSARPRIAANCVTRQLRPPRNLSNGQMLAQRPTPNNTQKRQVDHSVIPRCQQPRGRCHMGQFSVKIMPLTKSLLSANQQAIVRMPCRSPLRSVCGASGTGRSLRAGWCGHRWRSIAISGRHAE